MLSILAVQLLLVNFGSERGTEMRLKIAVAIASIYFSPTSALAQDGSPAAGPRPSLSSQIASMPVKAGVSSDRLVFVSAGAVFVMLAMNFVSGGMIGAPSGIGVSNVSAASLAGFAVSEVAWHGTIWGIGPATVLSVGQPVDAALRDGYTTPSTLAAAFVESGRRAEVMVLNAGTYVGETVGAWWDRL
jgi:hypothetical protein